MQSSFQIEIRADPDKRRCHIFSSGQMDSAAYVDAQMKHLVANVECFQFDRVTDIRQCVGHVTYDDVIRYGQFWQMHKVRMTRQLAVAVVTSDRYLIARLPMCNVNYPNQTMCAFLSGEEAQAWIDTGLPFVS